MWKTKYKQTGFTLMVVLSVLSTFCSIAIGFAILSILNKKRSQNFFQSSHEIAKSNAINALNIALSHLQYDLGKDTITTAKANINTATTNNKQHWIGSWNITKVDDTDVEHNDNLTFQSWLVSGIYNQENNSTTEFEKPYINILPETIYDTTPPVYVELIDNQNHKKITTGQYAYWIDDLSLKATYNLSNNGFNNFPALFTDNTTYSITDDTFYLTRTNPQIIGISLLAMDMFYNEGINNFPIEAQPLQTYLQSTIHYSELLKNKNYSTNQKQSIINGLHDITCCSIGLHTDPRNGGWKRTLINFHDYNSQEFPNNAFIFTPPDNTTPSPPPTWGYLKSFICKSSELLSNNSLDATTTYPLYQPESGKDYSDCKLYTYIDENNFTYGSITGKNSEDLGIATNYGIYPIFLGFKNFYAHGPFSASGPYQESNYTDNGYKILTSPGFLLFNPYPYTLKLDHFKLQNCSPYNTNLESSSSYAQNAYQKTPSFYVQLFDESSAIINEGYHYESTINRSKNPGTDIFPFISNKTDRSMRAIWQTSCNHNSQLPANDYPNLFSLTSTERKSILISPEKELDSGISLSNRDFSSITPIASDAANPTSNRRYCDIKLYLSENSQTDTYTSVKCTSWKDNSTDQWDNMCLQLLDNNGNIFQQISNIKLHSNIDSDSRNISSINDNKIKPLWLYCACRRQSNIKNDNGHGFSSSNYSFITGRPLLESNPIAPISINTPRQDEVEGFKYSGNTIPGNSQWNAHWLFMGNDQELEPSQNIEHIDFDSKEYDLEYEHLRNTFDLLNPHHYLCNIGSLQHFNAGCFSYHPPFAIGNSFQNPWIPRNKWFVGNETISGSIWPSHTKVAMMYDYSYILNRTLWDSYYISSYSLTDDDFFKNHRDRAFLTATQSDLKDNLQSGSSASAHLGMFNINSTSIPAWTAFIGSALNLNKNNNTVQFSHIQSIEDTDKIGLVELSFEQTKTLATKIVEQIKLRGPAAGVSGFINRKLINKDDDKNLLGIKGALQSAIDSTDINSSIHKSQHVTAEYGKEWYDDEAASGDYWTCQSGYLTQADILQTLGNDITCRGDTFCIHVYGNAVDDDNEILSEVWCEAIVQRMTELNLQHKSCGRQFKILSLKWL